MKSVNSNKMDEQMKVKFDEFTPPVPADLWNKIENQLDSKQPIKGMPVRRIRSFFFIYGGTVAAMLLIAFAFWKFGEQETIVLKQSSEVYASRITLGENEPTQVSRKDKQRIKQESALESSPIVAVKKPTKTVGKAMLKSQAVEVKSLTEAKVEQTQGELDYHAIYAESAFSLSGTEEPMATHELLPFEGEIIALQEISSFHEDIQENLTSEIIPSKSKKIGVSTVLNFLAKGLSNESGKAIEFSESEEGILKLDLKPGFAKSND